MVEWKKIEELGSYFGGLTGKTKEDFEDGNAKFITYMNVFANPSLNPSVVGVVKINKGEKQNKVQKGDILFTGSSETPEETGMSCVVTDEPEGDFYMNSFCFGLRLFTPEQYNLHFLKHLFRSESVRKSIAKTASGVTRFNISKARFSKIQIPIPSLYEQTRIVGILDTFTDAIENLKQQIAERRKQYEHYRDELLGSEEKVDINSVACFVKDRIPGKELTAKNYTSVENLLKDKAGRKDAESVPTEGSWIKYQKGDVLIGNIRPYLRKIWLSDREGGTNGDVIVIRSNNQIIPAFLYCCLASEGFFQYYNQSLKDGKMPRGEKNRILSYMIPSIDKKEQSRIVSILDTFEASIANLEAQLKEREKQYEYYRNKLLTFD